MALTESAYFDANDAEHLVYLPEHLREADDLGNVAEAAEYDTILHFGVFSCVGSVLESYDAVLHDV